jgi:hypothetical protein
LKEEGGNDCDCRSATARGVDGREEEVVCLVISTAAMLATLARLLQTTEKKSKILVCFFSVLF